MSEAAKERDTMRERMLATCLGLGLAAVALSACTASPYIPEDKFAQAADSRLMVVTGSRIPQMVDMNEHNPRTATPTSIITADDLQKTGETSLCRALMRIVPNMVRPSNDMIPTTRGMMIAARC